jgi:hypothetical protein
MLIKNGESEFERLAKKFGANYELSGRERVFDTEKECIEYHSNN